MAPAISRTPRYKYQFVAVSKRSSPGKLLIESAIFSSTETEPSTPISDIQDWLVFPSDLELASRSPPGGKVSRDPMRRASRPRASAGANSPEATRVPGCQSRFSSAEEPPAATCPASIPSEGPFALNRESSETRAAWQRTRRCAGPGTEVELPRNEPCSCDPSC